MPPGDSPFTVKFIIIIIIIIINFYQMFVPVSIWQGGCHFTIDRRLMRKLMV